LYGTSTTANPVPLPWPTATLPFMVGTSTVEPSDGVKGAGAVAVA
jgi:hypothetical protein